jgi:hypothetical protein
MDWQRERHANLAVSHALLAGAAAFFFSFYALAIIALYTGLIKIWIINPVPAPFPWVMPTIFGISVLFCDFRRVLDTPASAERSRVPQKVSSRRCIQPKFRDQSTFDADFSALESKRQQLQAALHQNETLRHDFSIIAAHLKRDCD